MNYQTKDHFCRAISYRRTQKKKLIKKIILYTGLMILITGLCSGHSKTNRMIERINSEPNSTYQENIYIGYAEKAANWLISIAVEVSPGVFKWPYREEESIYPVGIGSGTAGVGMFLLELYKVTQNPDYLEYAEGAGKFIGEYEFGDVDIDWLSGAAGAGYYLLDLWEVTGNTYYLDLARNTGNWLIEKHYEENGGYYWKHFPEYPDIFTGWAHGAAGIGAFFARLFRETQDGMYLEYARGAATWINSYLWETEPGHYAWPRLTTDDHPQTTWCGGSVGIIRFFLLLYDSTGDIVYLDYARGGTDWLIDAAFSEGDGCYSWSHTAERQTNFYAYCHGTPSVVHLLYEMYERTGHQQYCDYARGGAKWLRAEADRVYPFCFRWPHYEGGSFTTGLLIGTAGVGYSFLLSYSYEEDPSYLEYAKGAANWLISEAESTTSNGIKWGYPNENFGTFHETSLYAGTSGIGIFFLELSQISMKQDKKISKRR